MPFLRVHIFCLFFLSCVIALAQPAQELFGKNRIQYKNFKWQFISTFNFDIYYYEGGKELAEATAKYVENDFNRISDLTGFLPYSKIKLLIYNSVADQQQSNIGLDDSQLIGGQTNFVKSTIEVAFRGTQSELKKEISRSMAALLLNTMLYGGSLREVIQSAYMLALPEWFVKGAALYIAEGWSTEMDDYIRDAMLYRNIKNPVAFSEDEAGRAGQSIWNYIVQKYGKSYMGNVLYLTRVVRNDRASIESSIGISYNQFISDWSNYYITEAQRLNQSYKEVPDKDLFISAGRKHNLYSIQLSPSGNKVAFANQYKGKYYVAYKVVGKNKVNKVLRGGHRIINQPEDNAMPVLAWKSEDELAVVSRKKDHLYLTTININNKKQSDKIPLDDFTQILDFKFSEDRQQIVLSAAKRGQSDIYLYTINSKTYTQLTNDAYDDVDPIIAPNGSIIFSSNRPDTGTGTIYYKNISPEFNIFSLPAGIKNAIPERITANSNNTNSRLLDNNSIVYLSSQKGITNLFRYNLTTGERTEISDFIQNISEYDISTAGHNLIFKCLRKGKQNLYLIKNYDFEEDYNIPLTQRQLNYIKLYPQKKEPELAKAVTDTSATDIIDINNYKFESDLKQNKKSEKEVYNFNNSKKEKSFRKDEIKISGPYPSKNLFSVNRLTTTLAVDPLKGTGILLEAAMGDMFGNNRMTAGLFGISDFKSSNIYGEYQYLKKRTDFKVRYDKETFYALGTESTQRYTLNRVTTTASYPISSTTRVSISPMLVTTRYTDLDSIQTKDQVVAYAAFKSEFIFDNSVTHGLNDVEGARVKATFEEYASPGQSYRNFGKFTIDARYYQPIHRGLTFASRASFGAFLGPAKKNFLLGGMDNWLFNSSSRNGANNPLRLAPEYNNSDLLFVRFVTNMRGFIYNTQYGSNFFLLNEELRWPVVRYFYRGAISSNFLKNLQLVAFTDIGSAWSGLNPFNSSNNINTQVVTQAPFTATVRNYINPFLISYGGGVRTLVLGYYIKFDVGWGILNYKVQSPKFYLTLGYDF